MPSLSTRFVLSINSSPYSFFKINSVLKLEEYLLKASASRLKGPAIPISNAVSEPITPPLISPGFAGKRSISMDFNSFFAVDSKNFFRCKTCSGFASAGNSMYIFIGFSILI